MSTDIQNWIQERETIHRNGWAGEWSWSLGDLDRATLRATGPTNFDLIRDDEYRGPSEVLDEIVDAHNTLPKLLAGVRAVLELHRPDQPEPKDWMGRDRVQYCKHCEANDAHTGEPLPVPWPCATVQKLQEAINDE